MKGKRAVETNYAFVVPAFNPDDNLLTLIKELQAASHHRIFIIDDGSNDASSTVFQRVAEEFPRVVILKHAVNLGKGAALKTVFNHILTNFPEIDGVVTLDSDGQHSVKDCIRVLDTLKNGQESFVLGCRQFKRNIPLKSYIGNNISNFIYRLILGHKFQDTQTGLRGLTKSFMAACLSIHSNRFEFETEQLVMASHPNSTAEIVEIPIETIYKENNKATTFRPLVDSFRVYFILFRYGASSLITAAVDFIVFFIALSFGSSVLVSNLLSRTASIFVQFTLLNHMVFYTKAKIVTFMLFVSYVYIMGIASAWLQVALRDHFTISEVGAKLGIEFLLFFVNFAFLRVFIFKKTSRHRPTD